MGHREAFLQPDPATDTLGRSSFSIHGGYWPGSEGCIDLGPNERAYFAAVRNLGDSTAQVVVRYDPTLETQLHPLASQTWFNGWRDYLVRPIPGVLDRYFPAGPQMYFEGNTGAIRHPDGTTGQVGVTTGPDGMQTAAAVRGDDANRTSSSRAIDNSLSFLPPMIPTLAPGGPFDWLQSDLPGKVGGLAPGGGLGPPPSTIGLGGGASLFSPQGFDFGGAQAWPSARSFDGSGTLNIYNGMVPPLPYLPSGSFSGGLMRAGALGAPQPNPPAVGGVFSAPPPQIQMTAQPFPATPSSPFSVPVPPALLPLVEHFFPQWLDANSAPAWPSGGTPDDADTQPNFAGSAGGSLGLTAAQPTPQPLPAAPTSPFSVPVPPALLPLARHFFPQWLDTNKAPAWPSAETSDDGGT